MAQTIASIDSGHGAPINDAQLDYYGKRLATASSDHVIRVWDTATEPPSFVAELKGHEGPVWQVAWAHPKYGNLLASCSYDRKVFVWKEVRAGDFQVIYRYEDQTASVNAVQFGPWEYGLHLACGSSDGTVAVLSYKPDGTWDKKVFEAHAGGVNALSWAPAACVCPRHHGTQGTLATQYDYSDMKMVTGGCDNAVRVWGVNTNTGQWEQVNAPMPQGHSEWVRDVAWRPYMGIPANTIVSCSEDTRVILWTQANDQGGWQVSHAFELGQPVWRVSWSATGSLLAVSTGDNNSVLFKDTLDGRWERVTSMNEHGVTSPLADPTQAAQSALQPMGSDHAMSPSHGHGLSHHHTPMPVAMGMAPPTAGLNGGLAYGQGKTPTAMQQAEILASFK